MIQFDQNPALHFSESKPSSRKKNNMNQNNLLNHKNILKANRKIIILNSKRNLIIIYDYDWIQFLSTSQANQCQSLWRHQKLYHQKNKIDQFGEDLSPIAAKAEESEDRVDFDNIKQDF